MQKKSSLLSTIIVCLVLLVIPFVIGGIISYLMEDTLYLEVILVIFGLLELLMFTLNFRRRDNKNYKKNRTLYEDKTTQEYKEFRVTQNIIAALGVISILASIIVFYIGKIGR